MVAVAVAVAAARLLAVAVAVAVAEGKVAVAAKIAKVAIKSFLPYLLHVSHAIRLHPFITIFVLLWLEEIVCCLWHT